MGAPIARVGDPVTHSPVNAIAIVGGDAAIAIAVIAIIKTGGGAAVAASRAARAWAMIKTVAPLLDTGADLFALAVSAVDSLQSWLPQSVTGKIKEGSGDVFAGSKRVARMTDLVECEEPMAGKIALLLSMGSGVTGKIVYAHQVYRALKSDDPSGLVPGAHVPSDIVLAARTVLTNGFPTARITSRNDCGSQVSEGLESVRVGGPDGIQLGENGSEVNAALQTTWWLASWLGSIAGWVTEGPYAISIGITKSIFKAGKEAGIVPETVASWVEPALDIASGDFSRLKKVLIGGKILDASKTSLAEKSEEPVAEDWRAKRDPERRRIAKEKADREWNSEQRRKEREVYQPRPRHPGYRR